MQNYLYAQTPTPVETPTETPTLTPTATPEVTPSESPTETPVITPTPTTLGSIFGTVTDELGFPISGAIVSLKSREPKIRYSTVTDIDGKYEFLSLSAGKYKIKVKKKGYSSENEKVELLEGENKQIDFHSHFY